MSGYPIFQALLFLPILITKNAIKFPLDNYLDCSIKSHTNIAPAGIYLLKVDNGNTRTRYEISSKLNIKTLERRSSVFIVSFEHISHLVPVFLLLTLNM